MALPAGPLRSRAFRRVWFGEGFSLLGDASYDVCSRGWSSRSRARRQLLEPSWCPAQSHAAPCSSWGARSRLRSRRPADADRGPGPCGDPQHPGRGLGAARFVE